MFGYVAGFAAQVENQCDAALLRREELRQAWRDTMKMPRKKKKRVRKLLKIDWQFNEWVIAHYKEIGININ